jgi:polysaccharide pyruvyl transferase WcaK-like protein
MTDHLREVTGVFARESATIKYLEEIGITSNVYSVADPAFLMEPVKPVGFEEEMSIEEGAIGLNLSPLMARYITGVNLEGWIKVAMKIISEVAEVTGVPVYLIPHVTSPHSDDYTFMQKTISRFQGINHDITLIPPHYNAAETKWIISQMTLFAGARTHSTIAALSSGVPTLSFAYSIKAQGINRDIFGHADYCMEPTDLDARVVASRITSMLEESTLIRRDLGERIPGVRKAALKAGMELKHLTGVN